MLYRQYCVVFFVHSRSRQYRGVPILVTTEMQQTLPVGKTCNDLDSGSQPIISRSAPSHIRSTIRKFCCLSIWYDTEICGCGVNYILHSHGRWVSLYPPRVTEFQLTPWVGIIWNSLSPLVGIMINTHLRWQWVSNDTHPRLMPQVGIIWNSLSP